MVVFGNILGDADGPPRDGRLARAMPVPPARCSTFLYVVERGQRHGLAPDLRLPSCRSAHRTRNRPVGAMRGRHVGEA